MDLRLQGKRALITGSSGGIGEAIARILAAEGVRVVVHGRKEAEAQRVAQAIREDGGQATVARGDLASDEQARHVAGTALEAFGGIDIAVNNAGAYLTDDWLSPDPAAWLDIYNQNTVSMIRLIRYFVRPMREAGWGRFIQVASGAATAPMPQAAAYAASKAAVLNLTVSPAKGLAGTGVTANAISPGVIRTPAVEWFMNDLAAKQGWTGAPEEIERRFLGLFGPLPPTARLGRVEEIADLVAFIASPRADYLNGANLRLDGGFVPTVN